MSKINPLYEYGDIKYFRNLHRQRQAQMGGVPVGYGAFVSRLQSGMSLKEAIYTPSNTNMARNRINMKPKPTWNERLHNIWIRFISFFR